MEKESKVVHIIPMGLELDRVIGGLKAFPTNKAILLYGSKRTTKIEDLSRKNGSKVRKLVSATIDIEEREVDIFDFYESTRMLRELMTSLGEKGFQVYVNISTGNRIVTSAALVACFLTNAHPYYVRPESYSIPEHQEVLSSGVSEVMEIPRVSINGPSRHEIAVLEAMGRAGGSVKHETELITLLEDRPELFGDRREEGKRRSSLSRKRANISRLLRSLEKGGYVVLTKKGKYVQAAMTESGMLFGGLSKKGSG